MLHVDISTILILPLKPYACSGEQQITPSLENIYIKENLLVLASSLFWQYMRYYIGTYTNKKLRATDQFLCS